VGVRAAAEGCTEGTDLAVIDFERLDAAITYASEHPAEFDMYTWFKQTRCGTTACLAGTALLQAGYEPRFTASGRAEDVDLLDADGDPYSITAAWRDGVAYPVSETAAELLGLTVDQADEIFNLADLDEVIEMRNHWAAEAGVPERIWGER